jgi:dipeptidyl aminopeptidase/acylaminoacyl peptidase
VTTVLPYGTWPSPLSAKELAAGAVAPGDLLVDGDRLLWIESRPAEQGRQALVATSSSGVDDLAPDDFNTRTRVHEYGGAPFTAGHGRVIASRWDDQRLYDITPDGPVPVTPESALPAAVRWADGRLLDADTLIAVRELHHDQVDNEVVRVDLRDGSQDVLVSGRDFVAAPRPSPDGRRLAWLAWDHPDMPWDGAELWVATLTPDGLADPVRLAGGGDVSVCALAWVADGRLAFTGDETGCWEVHVWDPSLGVSADAIRSVTSLGADIGGPAWTFGTQAMAPVADGRLACVVTEHAMERLVLLDVDSGDTSPVRLPYAYMDRVHPWRDGIAFLAAEATGRRVVATWSPTAGVTEIRTYDIEALGPRDRPVPEPIEVPTPDGQVTHAFLYRPCNGDIAGPDNERPPLIVFTHGGPTGNVWPVLTPSIAYWTTRGFAVADVNYRGSTGFGRAYRDALRGRWGELDVIDTIAVAQGLADAGIVDGDRMAIRGGSAGGYTTLAVLTTPDHPFACGTSFFGVADLELLARHTHKFESRYLDQVVGPLPDAADIYRQRSPLHRAHLLSKPLLVLQGLEDKVVPPEQSEAIVAAAADQGVPHCYIAFEGEQHGFRRAENIVTWLESELAFYGQVMGFTPAGDLPEITLTTG